MKKTDYADEIPPEYRKATANGEGIYLDNLAEIVTCETLHFLLMRLANESQNEEYEISVLEIAAKNLNKPIYSLLQMLREYQNGASENLHVVNAADWLNSEPPPADQIMTDLFDKGDKVGIIGGSKQKKSFFFIQMVMCLATGKEFLGFQVPKKRRILMVQFEINKNHYHRRIKMMAEALGISAEELDKNMLIINARGQRVTAAKVETEICQIAIEKEIDFVAFDPLYKLMEEGENGPAEFRPILYAFDYLTEKAEAAVAYVHHDPKGEAGDKYIQDRGSGSNILGRDYDACFALSAHGCGDSNVAVVEVLLRNYPQRDGISIKWDGNRFIPCPDLPPTKRTSKNKKNGDKLPLDTYERQAIELVKDKPLKISVFKDRLKKNCVLTIDRTRAVVDYLTSSGKLAIHREKSRGTNNCWIGLPSAIEEMKRK